jgi:hypothetical protein
LDISYGSGYSIIHKAHGYHKICARWVPKQLTDDHKWAPAEVFMQFLQRYRDGEAWLSWNGLSQAMKHGVHASLWIWMQTSKHRVETSSRTKKFKSVLYVGNVMLTLFWDFNGPFLGHYEDRGKTINSVRYCAMF